MYINTRLRENENGCIVLFWPQGRGETISRYSSRDRQTNVYDQQFFHNDRDDYLTAISRQKPCTIHVFSLSFISCRYVLPMFSDAPKISQSILKTILLVCVYICILSKFCFEIWCHYFQTCNDITNNYKYDNTVA